MKSPLVDFLDEKISEDLGVKPEQITSEFIEKMRERMYKDPQFQFDRSSEFLHDPDVQLMDFEESKVWRKKCQSFAQEVLKEIEKSQKPRAT